MLFCDNKSVMHLVSNPSHHERSKHIDIHYQFLQVLVKKQLMTLIHVRIEH